MTMDPDIALERMRELVKSMLAAYEDQDGNGIDQEEANALAEYMQALDGWIAGGGFLPADWSGTKTRHPVKAKPSHTARTIGLVSLGKSAWTASNLEPRDFTNEEQAIRRADVRGTIVGHSDSHGLCYRLRHDDGTEAHYDPDELTFSRVRSAEGEG